MKKLELLLKENDIDFSYVKMGNMLYLPEYHPSALQFDINLEDNEKIEVIEKYLKSHKKTLYFNHTMHTACSDPDIHYYVLKADEEKKLYEIEKKDAAIRDHFWSIYNKDKEKAERFYHFMKKKLKTA